MRGVLTGMGDWPDGIGIGLAFISIGWCHPVKSLFGLARLPEPDVLEGYLAVAGRIFGILGALGWHGRLLQKRCLSIEVQLRGNVK